VSIPEDLKSILDPDEKVEMYIIQKFYLPKLNVDSVSVTDKRIILRHPHGFGLKKNYTDFKYSDLANVIIETGLVRSAIKLTLKLGGEPLDLKDIPNAEAQKAYGIIRENINNATLAVASRNKIPQVIFCKFCGAKNNIYDTKCVNCGALLK